MEARTENRFLNTDSILDVMRLLELVIEGDGYRRRWYPKTHPHRQSSLAVIQTLLTGPSVSRTGDLPPCTKHGHSA